jgi:hypothetical protein
MLKYPLTTFYLIQITSSVEILIKRYVNRDETYDDVRFVKFLTYTTLIAIVLYFYVQ